MPPHKINKNKPTQPKMMCCNWLCSTTLVMPHILLEKLADYQLSKWK